MNLRKMILGANFTEIVIAKDLRIPNENVTLLGWSGLKFSKSPTTPIGRGMMKPPRRGHYDWESP